MTNSRTYPLRRTATIVLNAEGNGIAQLGPISVQEYWYPTSVTLSASGPIVTNGTPSTAFLYVGPDSNSYQYVDGTYQVSVASSSAINGQVLTTGLNVFAVWTNCNPEATATMTVIGTRTLP